ncbi:MAG TPA: response regulator [Vicinamibacteria bacterium]
MTAADILVAEDERIVARHIRDVLHRSGYRVPATVGTGEDAVVKAAELKPDLVLMDVALGGAMDGIEAARRIREATGIPVIYVTAYADDAMLERVKRTEPAGFVLKPFDDRELRAMVEVTLYRADASRRRAGQRALAADAAELAGQRDRLRRMYAATLDAREQEARRIARELHDQAGQLLSALHLALEEVGAHVEPGARGRIPELRAMVDEVEQELRRIAHEMRPPILDDLGLVPAIDFMARGLARRSGLDVRVTGTRARMPAEVETNLYRIAQEALGNVIRHADAGKATVQVAVRSGEATIEVRDDGRGFAVDEVLRRRGERGIGFLGMQERVDALGGRLRVESSPEAGTRVRVTVPLAAPDP